MKANNLRKAENALKEILDKADNNANGRVELQDFLRILEENGVEVRSSIENFLPWEKETIFQFNYLTPVGPPS